MDLKNGSTVLFVKDISTSKEFYTDLLGFSVNLDFGKNIVFTNGLAIWEIWNEHIIPSTLGEKNTSDSTVNRFELCFETENMLEVVEHLHKNKVRILHEIHEEPWGQRTIRFFDPDNHLIEIGESMQQFVSRFYKQGLSVEQVSERTSIPVDEVKRLISRSRE